MTEQEVKDNAPDGATHYIKKPFGSVKYLHGNQGVYWYLNKQGIPTDMCREWIVWIKPL